MANAEHLALIKQGVEVWNSWYKKHRQVVPDLSQADLSNLNLRGINLNRAILKQTNFSQTDLSKAELNNANLVQANLLKGNLLDTHLKGANLDYVIFAQALINAKTVISTKYRQVYEIINHQAKDKNFANLDLSNANLFRADLSNAELSNANLQNANLNSANLNSAYLHKANLTGAILQNADLRNAYFSQANLTSAYLGGALCCGTYFKDAELKFANLKTAKFSQKTMIDLKWYSIWEIVNHGAVKKNLSGADLSNANLQGVNFEEANLTNAKLSNAILRQSNLTNANLTNSDLVGANVCGVDLDQANLKGAKLKSVISDHRTKLSVASSQKTNLMVKERPVIQSDTAALWEAPTRIQSEPLKSTQAPQKVEQKLKQKSGTNWVGIFLITMLTGITTVGYLLWTQNPEHPWSLKLKTWGSQLEQLMPKGN